MLRQLPRLLLMREAIGRGIEAVVFEFDLGRTHALGQVKCPHIGTLLQAVVGGIKWERGATGQEPGIIAH